MRGNSPADLPQSKGKKLIPVAGVLLGLGGYIDKGWARGTADAVLDQWPGVGEVKSAAEIGLGVNLIPSEEEQAADELNEQMQEFEHELEMAAQEELHNSNVEFENWLKNGANGPAPTVPVDLFDQTPKPPSQPPAPPSKPPTIHVEPDYPTVTSPPTSN